MTDEVLTELWQAKDSIAEAHGHDIERLAAYFMEQQAARAGGLPFATDAIQGARATTLGKQPGAVGVRHA